MKANLAPSPTLRHLTVVLRYILRTILCSMYFDSSKAADQDDPTHLSGILAGNGLPVADTLKDGMYEEVARLVRPGSTRADQQARSSATGGYRSPRW